MEELKERIGSLLYGKGCLDYMVLKDGTRFETDTLILPGEIEGVLTAITDDGERTFYIEDIEELEIF